MSIGLLQFINESLIVKLICSVRRDWSSVVIEQKRKA